MVAHKSQPAQDWRQRNDHMSNNNYSDLQMDINGNVFVICIATKICPPPNRHSISGEVTHWTQPRHHLSSSRSWFWVIAIVFAAIINALGIVPQLFGNCSFLANKDACFVGWYWKANCSERYAQPFMGMEGWTLNVWRWLGQTASKCDPRGVQSKFACHSHLTPLLLLLVPLSNWLLLCVCISRFRARQTKDLLIAQD